MMLGRKIPAALMGWILVLAPGATGLAQKAPEPMPRFTQTPAPSAPRQATKAPRAAPSGDQAARGLPAVLDLQINKAQSIDLPSTVSRVVIGNEAVADIQLDADSLGKAFIMARSVGSTNVFFMDSDGKILHQIEVRVTFDHQVIERALRQLIKGSSIKVSVMRNTVFLTGKVRSAADSAKALSIARRFSISDEDVINMLTVQGAQQVLLKVKVAEISRTITKNLAVNQFVNLRLPTGKTLTFGTSAPATASANAFASGRLVTRLTGFDPTTFAVLEKQGLVKNLAEPTLVAISGQSASFLSGGETPVPSGITDSGDVTYSYREFGIRLNFTPVVIDKGRINLSVEAEVSALDTANAVNNYPAFTNKRTATTVDLPSGGSIMISGLLQDDVTDTVNGFPFLKDIPILGALFRSSEFLRSETELVITVTAYLVKPADSAAAISVPTDGFEPAGDLDFYLLGRLHREYTDGERPIWAPSLKGPFGYIME